MTIRPVLQLGLLTLTPLFSQTPMENPGSREGIHLLPSDASVLDGEEERKDILCTIKPVNPTLGFDFNFHARYTATIPKQQLFGSKELMVIIRVVSETRPDDPAYFHQKWRVPRMEEDAKGEAEVWGGFILGPGKYQIDWMMRDQSERVCSARWQVSAGARGKDRDVQPRLAAGTVEPEPTELFESELQLKARTDQGLKVLVVVQIAPVVVGGTKQNEEEIAALVAILRDIAREPLISAYSVIAFNLERGDVLYRKDSTPEVDFPGLGEAIKHLKPGTIDVRALQQSRSSVQLLSELVGDETAKSHPDAVIIVGHRIVEDRLLWHSVSPETKAPLCPVVYLNYESSPITIPGRDPVARIVKSWKGSEYNISKPRDLFVAWTDLMGRLVNSRAARAVLPKN